MRKQSIFKALPIVAAHYGNKFGVKVIVGGEDAYTDMKVIVIPNVKDDYPQKKVIWGYLVHEAGHIRFTDFELFKTVVAGANPLRQTILNIIEDYRIEREMIAMYPGVLNDLKQTVSYLKDTGQFKHLDEDSSEGAVLVSRILFWLRSKLLSQPLEELEQESEHYCDKTFSVGVNTRLTVLLVKANSVATTQDCLDLTDSILLMLEDESKKENDDNDQQQDSKADDADSPDDANMNSSDDDSHNQSNPNQSNDGHVDGSDSSDPQNNSGSTSAVQNALSSTQDDLPDDIYQSLKDELIEHSDTQGDGSYAAITSAAEVEENDYGDSSALYKSVIHSTSKLRAQLIGLVQSNNLNIDRAAYSGRRLFSSKLHRLISGDTKIFRQRDMKKMPNTAVHILTDLSGSMNGHSADVAKASSLAIALALDGIPGVNPAVTYFGGGSDDSVRAVVKHGQSVKQRLKQFSHPTWGCTPLAEAIWYSAFQLSKTRENRHIIIVVTDGEPNDLLATKKVLSLCEDSGIETIGIGIKEESVKDLFHRSIVINSVDELNTTLFQVMQKSLLSEVA